MQKNQISQWLAYVGTGPKSSDDLPIHVLVDTPTTWRGYVEVAGRQERLWSIFRWDEGEEKFMDAECHKQLNQIAELYRKKSEKIEHILYAMYQSKGVVSTEESSLRDLLFLNPRSITIIYSPIQKMKRLILICNFDL